jgi:hypothetical protein
MKALILIAAVLVLNTGCATLYPIPYPEPAKSEPIVSTYKIELDAKASKTKAAPGKVIFLGQFGSFFKFLFINDSKATSKILWEESALLSPLSQSHRVMPEGAKLADANKSHPPAIVPAGGQIMQAVAYADGVRWARGGPYSVGSWEIEDIVPCSTNREVSSTGCNPTEMHGKTVGLLLTVEQNGKKTEYKLAARISENPEYKAYLEKKAEEKPVAPAAAKPSDQKKPVSFSVGGGN